MIIEVIPSKNGEFFQKKWKDSMILFCRVTARCQTHWSPHDMAPNTWENGEKRGKVPPNYGFRIVFVFFLAQVLDFFWLSFLVPCALYLQQFGTRICHFAWYLLHFGMITLHFAWYLLHLAMFALHFAWYLPRFGTSTSHLHGICFILVLQTFIWVLQSFFRLSISVSFIGVRLGFH
jgi:hypothetical protein